MLFLVVYHKTDIIGEIWLRLLSLEFYIFCAEYHNIHDNARVGTQIGILSTYIWGYVLQFNMKNIYLIKQTSYN